MTNPVWNPQPGDRTGLAYTAYISGYSDGFHGARCWPADWPEAHYAAGWREGGQTQKEEKV